MPTEQEWFSGYDIMNIGERDRDTLTASGLRFAYAAPSARVHDAVDPRGSLRVEMQYSLSSCTGNGCTTACEAIAGWQLGSFENVPQLSRWFSYKTGQKLWGHEGRDIGCSIQGVVDAAKRFGHCLESIVKYPSAYNNSPFQQAALADALNRRIQSHTPIETCEDWINYIDAGFGAVVFGVVWTKRMRACTGRLTLADVREDGSRGGHCMAGVGFTRDGKVLWANSHSERWAKGGYAEVDPDAIDYLLQRPYTVAIGISDLTGFDKTRVLSQSKGMG